MSLKSSALRSLLASLGAILAALTLTAAGLIPAVLGQEPSLEALWIDLRMGPPLIPIYNDVARVDDIARVDSADQIAQLRATTNGRKMVVFKSIAEAEAALPAIAGEIDIIGYNSESESATPARELDDPVESIRAMRALADRYGLELAFGPDHDLALSHGAAMAPFADIFVLQVQRQQTNAPVVEEFVRPIIPKLRQANPDLAISVQVRTEGDVDEIVALLDGLKADLDGISILTSPETVETAELLLSRLRGGESPLQQLVRQSSVLLYVALGLLAGLMSGMLYRRLRGRERPSPSDKL